MRDHDARGASRPDAVTGDSPEGTAVSREARRAAAAIAGYVAFYAIFPLLFACAFFDSFTHWAAITAYVLIGLVVFAAIGINFEAALGLFRTRRAAAGMSVTLAVASGLAILVMVNYLSTRHYWTWDITENQRFTLSGQSQNWLDRLAREEKKIRVVGFLPYRPPPGSSVPGDYRWRITEILKLYERSDWIEVTVVDLDREAGRAEAVARSIGMKIEDIPPWNVVLKCGEKLQKLTVTNDIFESIPPGPWGPQGPTTFWGERAITSAIRDLLDPTPRRVRFVTGHGEGGTGLGPRDYGGVVDQLRTMNFEVKDLNLAEEGKVPDDTNCLVIAGPTRPFLKEELDLVESYLEEEGRLVVLLDHLDERAGEMRSGLEKILEKYGVVVHQDALAVGPEMMFLGGRNVSGIPSDRHKISRPLLAERVRATLREACCLETTTSEVPGYRATAILEGTSDSGGQRRTGESGRYSPDEGLPEPTVLGVAVEAVGAPGVKKGDVKLVVFSDADFIINRLMRYPDIRRGPNPGLFLNSVNTMVGRAENLDISPKDRDVRTVYMNPVRRRRVFWGAVVGPAVLMAALGIVVWWRRSR